MSHKLTSFAIVLLSLLMVGDANCQIRQCDCNETVSVSPCDDVVLISARQFDCHCPASNDVLRRQCYCLGQWRELTCDDFSSTNNFRGQQTVVFVHGYQTDLQDAKKSGLQVYKNLFGQCRQIMPVRFVIWAWKSERETGRPVQDFHCKAQRAAALGDMFALTLNELGPEPPVVIGYSLGAQVVTSAMVQSNRYCGVPIRFAVIAAANDCGFASCKNQLWHCGNIERSYIFLNDGDRAIRAANAICKIKYGKQFIKFEDLAVQHKNQLGQIQIVDISNVASRKHSIVKYTSIPRVKSCIQELMNDLPDPLVAPGNLPFHSGANESLQNWQPEILLSGIPVGD